MKKLYLLIVPIYLLMSATGASWLFAQGTSGNFRSPVYEVDTFPPIFNMVSHVDTNTLLANIQHLQDYGTRDCMSAQAVQAQNWLKDKFESYGLSVELQDFPLTTMNPSDNVIATLPGTLHPEEYVHVGAHYDSFCSTGNAPGADDNASGTAGVLEIARILSDYQFDRSIVFGAWSAEEYGLYGSEAYAARAEQQGMKILGYFNLDMIGYQQAGQNIHTDMIAPASAKELSDFYKAVTPIYVTDFTIYDATVIPGGSDHQSFNDHDYMGIFPCEEDQQYSHLIHTPNDIIGPSFNSALKAQKFIQASLASVASLAIPITPSGLGRKAGNNITFKVFPNPSMGKITIESSSDNNTRMEICTMTGMVLESSSFSRHTAPDLSSLPKGIYLLNFIVNDTHYHQKLILK